MASYFASLDENKRSSSHYGDNTKSHHSTDDTCNISHIRDSTLLDLSHEFRPRQRVLAGPKEWECLQLAESAVAEKPAHAERKLEVPLGAHSLVQLSKNSTRKSLRTNGPSRIGLVPVLTKFRRVGERTKLQEILV
ncbi:hypothetical protein HG531_004427 [Fusarium graminearum]|nr:hypothetical protein HG531_004427 [Fusarium graminearum]